LTAKNPENGVFLYVGEEYANSSIVWAGGNGVKHARKEKDAETLAAQALKLVDLIGYQEGSVVSRTIVDRKAGTVTLFAFDEGQGLSEHTAPYDSLVQLLDGEAEITISRKPVILKEGEVVIMPAGKPHALKAIRRLTGEQRG
jgi:quercetin dioxygenase-like cupin family protein